MIATKATRLVGLLSAAAILTLGGSGSAQGLDSLPSPEGLDYTMTMLIYENGQPPQGARIYVSDQGYRIDDPDSTVIFSPDTGRTLVIDHRSKTYLEVPIKSTPRSSGAATGAVGRQDPKAQDGCIENGKQMVAGVLATKKVCDQGGEKTWMWVDPNGIPLQVAYKEETNIVMTAVEYAVGPQPASLFTPPGGYKKR